MAEKNYSTDKISRNEARKLVSRLAQSEKYRLSRHAKEEMSRERPALFTVDLVNVLKSPDAKILDEGELKSGKYNYRLQTNKILVVIAFTETGDSLIIITCWRF